MAARFEWAQGLTTVGDGVSTQGTFNTTDYGGSFSAALQAALNSGRGASIIPGTNAQLDGTTPVYLKGKTCLFIPPGVTVKTSSNVVLTGSPVAGNIGFEVTGEDCFIGGGGTIQDNRGASGSNIVYINDTSNVTVDGITFDMNAAGDDETNSIHCLNSSNDAKYNLKFKDITVHPNVATVCIAMPSVTDLVIDGFYAIPKSDNATRACRAVWSFNGCTNVKLRNGIARNLGTSGTGLVDGVLRDRNATSDLKIEDVIIRSIAIKDIAAPIGGFYFAGTLGLMVRNVMVEDFTTVEHPFISLFDTLGAGTGTAGRNATITGCNFYNVGKATATQFQVIRCGFSKAGTGFSDVAIVGNNFDACPYGAIQVHDSCADVLITDNRFVAAGSPGVSAIQQSSSPVPVRRWIRDNRYSGMWTSPYADPGVNGVYQYTNNWNMTDSTFANYANP